MKKRIIFLVISIIIIAIVSSLILVKLKQTYEISKPSNSPNSNQSEASSPNLGELYPKDEFTEYYDKYHDKRNPYYDSLSYEQKQKILSLSPCKVIELYENTDDYKIALAVLSPYALFRFTDTHPQTPNPQKIIEEKMKDIIKSRKHREIELCKDVTKETREMNQKFGIPPLPPDAFEFTVYFKDKEWPDLLFYALFKNPYDGHWQIFTSGTG